MSEKPGGFLTSIQGVLASIAALITAVTGLYLAVRDDTSQQIQQIDPVVISTSDTREINDNDTYQAEQAGDGVIAEPIEVIDDHPVETGTDNTSNSASLVECKSFPTVNTVTSLMGWSNHYHQQIIDAKGDHKQSLYPCEKTIDYRAQAHCKAPNDIAIRQALFETITLCQAAKIQVQDIIKH